MKTFKKHVHFIAVIFTLFIGACSKGDELPLPDFGFISILNLAGQNITAVQGSDRAFVMSRGIDDTKQNNSPAGKNRFRFYENESLLLLDTMLTVDPYYLHSYVAFKPNQNTALHVYDQQLNGLDKEPFPDAGYIKFSLANFSEQFPEKVNIYVTTRTIIDNASQEVQVGAFLDIKGSFSSFKNMLLGKTLGVTPEHSLKLTIKDQSNQVVLATTEIILPRGIVQGSKDLPALIYLIYINSSNQAKILMSK